MTIELTEEEIGLLILMLIEDQIREGEPLEYINILTQQKANSGEVLAKLISIRDLAHIKTRRMQ